MLKFFSIENKNLIMLHDGPGIESSKIPFYEEVELSSFQCYLYVFNVPKSKVAPNISIFAVQGKIDNLTVIKSTLISMNMCGHNKHGLQCIFNVSTESKYLQVP